MKTKNKEIKEDNNIKNSTLITEVNINQSKKFEKDNTSISVIKHSKDNSSLHLINKPIHSEEQILENNISSFKSKNNFDLPKIHLLDYFLHNQTEYLNLNKYEEYFTDELIKSNKHFSLNKDLLKTKQTTLDELDKQINIEILNHFTFSKSDIESAYCGLLKDLNNKINQISSDYEIYSNIKKDLNKTKVGFLSLG